MPAEAALFRCTNNGDNEGTLSALPGGNSADEVIHLGKGGTIPAVDTVMLHGIDLQPMRGQGQHPRINTGEFHRIEDTGLQMWEVTVDMSIKRTAGMYAMYILKRWYIENQTIPTTFPFGRIGLRVDAVPMVNVTPNANRAYVIARMPVVKDFKVPGWFNIKLTLRLSGSVGSPNPAGEYRW
jgi:hypothetical protein